MQIHNESQVAGLKRQASLATKGDDSEAISESKSVPQVGKIGGGGGRHFMDMVQIKGGRQNKTTEKRKRERNFLTKKGQNHRRGKEPKKKV